MARAYNRTTSARGQLRVTESRTGCWEFSFPFDRRLKDDLKSRVPTYGRKWCGGPQHWLVNREFYPVLQGLVMDYFGQTLPSKNYAPMLSLSNELTLELEYLGTAKDRPGGQEKTAMGMVAGTWMLVFPLGVLKAWFIPGYVDKRKETREPQPLTSYDVLGLTQLATQPEVKKAFRLIARKVHPDVSKEPDAKEQFMIAQSAYKNLTENRKRYDMALTFQSRAGKIRTKHYNPWTARGWRPPDKCGMVTMKMIPGANGFLVHEITGWDEIRDENGYVKVAFWDRYAKRPGYRWN